MRLLKCGDGKIRAVTLKTVKNDKAIYLNRPIEKLYPLILRTQEIVSQSDIEQSSVLSNVIDEENETRERARRIAAYNGILIRRLLDYAWLLRTSVVGML